MSVDLSRFEQEIETLKQNQNHRILPKMFVDGTVNLSTNDYLGLNHNENLLHKFWNTDMWQKKTFGAGSTRLLTGNIPEYELLEDRLASLYGKEACLVYNSGYHANLGILPAITSQQDLILADKYVHASLIDGLKLGEAKFMRFGHLDYDHLDKLLSQYASEYRQVIIVTEGVFSMDGKQPDLGRLIELKNQYNTLLYLDEAHAFGTIGENGLGVAELKGKLDQVDILVGTFGKSLASLGAFVVCPNVIKELLINKSRSLIYTTAIPPINMMWTLFALEEMLQMKTVRENIALCAKTLSDALSLNSDSHILPYILGENEQAISFAEFLKQKGFYVLPIRYPTVPKGTARVRFSINWSVTLKDVQRLIPIVQSYGD